MPDLMDTGEKGGRKMKRWSKVLVVPAGLLLIMFLVNTLLAEQEGTGKPSKAEVMQRTKKLQMPFIANEGQADERVMFYANTFGGMVFVTKDGEIVYALPHRKNAGVDAHAHNRLVNPPGSPMNKGEKGRVTPPFAKGNAGGFDDVHHSSPRPDSSGQADPQHKRKQGTADAKHEKGARGVVLKEEIIGGRIDKIKGEKKDITTVNDFRGNDPSKWKTNIPTYEVVTLGEVYEGIELKLKAYGNNIEKLFYVKPGADPGVIRLKLNGVQALRVNEDGQLEAETALGTVKFTKPIVYQEPKVPSPVTKESISSAPLAGKGRGEGDLGDRQYIESAYVVIGNEYSFKLGDYDRTKGLVIDPLLEFTYLGGSGSGFDSGNAIAIDSSGNIYVAGETQSSDFPTTTGAYVTSGGGFVSRLSSDLTSLLASTYIGVSISAITIDTEGNIYVSGGDNVSKLNGDLTNLLASKSVSSGTAIAIDSRGNIYVAGGDTVSKLNGDLTSLLASKSLSGGSINAIAIDSGGNIYVTGSTESAAFPTTPGAYDTFNDGYDAFVSKLSGDLTSLLASTYLGGSGESYYEEGNSLVIDSNGNIYVTGSTESPNFPTTPGAHKTSFCSDYDSGYCRAEAVGFVSELNGDLTSLLASTYLGLDDADTQANSLAIDSSGNIYVATIDMHRTGTTVVVSKLNGDLTSILASTYLGGSGFDNDQANAIAIDSGGNIYVTGLTGSPDFPTTLGAYDTSFNGGYYSGDAFVSKLNGDLSLLASTYLGGTGDGEDSGNAIAIDSGGDIYVTGSTYSSNFPITTGAYDSSYNVGNTDVFVSKLSGDLANLISSTYLGGTSYDDGNSLSIDLNGNIYVTGNTGSEDFPTTLGAYDTSFNGGYSDVFVSKLNGDLTSLLASTYLGGSGGSFSNSMTIDTSGDVYIAGVASSDFPTTPGAYDASFTDIYSDAFVSKLSGDLTNLIASTSLGGSDRDQANSIAIDSEGNIYVTGWTGSTDFPTTPGAYDTSFNGGRDVFVSKLNGALTNLLASTYLGGSSGSYSYSYDNEGDQAYSIAIDSGGDIYVTGTTHSTDFPSTPGAYDTSFNSSTTDYYGNYIYGDAFVSKLNGALTSLLASTYLGGYYGDHANSITIDSGGNIYVTGWTWSSDFPTTPGAYDTSYSGSYDTFVSKLNGNLTSLLASTYLGGTDYEEGNSLAIDASGNIYVTGSTRSTDFPTTLGAYDTSYSGYDFDAFVSKFDSNLSAQVMPTPVPIGTPTAITLLYFKARTGNDGKVTLTWETATEVDNAGFNLYRARRKNGTYTRINNTLINAKGDAVSGASYSYVDTPDRNGTYYYKLEDVDYYGVSTMHGPEKVRVRSGNNASRRSR